MILFFLRFRFFFSVIEHHHFCINITYNREMMHVFFFSSFSLSLSLAPFCKHLKRFMYVWERHYYRITFLFRANFASTINNLLRYWEYMLDALNICDDMTLLSHYFDTNQHKINDAKFGPFFTLFPIPCMWNKQMRETYRLLDFPYLFFFFSFHSVWCWF